MDVRSVSVAPFWAALLLVFSRGADAENWPAWRGPRGDGTSLEKRVPVRWDATRGVAWKTPLPGKGHASPIVWQDRVFVVSALGDTGQRILVCLDGENGAVRWQQVVLTAPPESLHPLNSLASSTPATDGEYVYVSFLDRDRMYVAAFDFKGKRVWETRPGVFASKHGYCSSPVLWKDKVIVNGDHDGPAYLVALDRADGKTLWKTPRPNNTRSYCPPIIRRIEDRNQMVLSGSLCVASYDPDTGKQHWIIDGPTEQYVASLVYNGELLFMTCGYPKRFMQAIRPDGHGNVTKTHVAWQKRKNCSYVPSPIAFGPYFLVVDDMGTATCFLAATGEALWKSKLGDRHSASLVATREHVYFVSDTGVTTVVCPGPDFKEVARNPVGEAVNASPAISGGRILLRGDKHLFCIKAGS